MKTAAVFCSGLLLSALACAPAAAETVRVRLTARVVSVTDPGTLLHGDIVPGQRLTGTYVYNTNTPDQNPDDPRFGIYRPYANEARVRLAAGGLVFESVQPTQGITIEVDSHVDGFGMFTFRSFENKPLPSTVSVGEISVELQGVGTVTESDALPTVAPDLLGYSTNVTIRGGGGGGNFEVRAEIEAAELIGASALAVSPAASNFLPQQHFDAAVTLPRNTSATTAQATANGHPLPLSYPGTCQQLAPNSAGQRSLLCPNVETVLSQAAGAPIEWTVVLTNGTTLTETVNWVLTQ